MNSARMFVALLAGHSIVAIIAWATGYAHGRLAERAGRASNRPGPYDWARHGECGEDNP